MLIGFPRRISQCCFQRIFLELLKLCRPKSVINSFNGCRIKVVSARNLQTNFSKFLSKFCILFLYNSDIYRVKCDKKAKYSLGF